MRRSVTALFLGLFAFPHLANTGTPVPPSVVELDFANPFQCLLPFGSNPEKVEFSQVFNIREREIIISDSSQESRKSIRAHCFVEDDSIYKCKWGHFEFVEVDLLHSQWVYISTKKFNYVLSGSYKDGIAKASRPIKCTFQITSAS